MGDGITGIASLAALERLGTGLGGSGIGAALTDALGLIVWASPAAATLLGGEDAGALTGTALVSLLDPDRDGTRDGTSVVAPRVRPDRQLRVIEAPWETGTLHLLMPCAGRGIREREHTEREVYLERAVEDSHDAILSLDTEGRIRYWNHGAEQIFGYSADEVLGRPYTLLVPHHVAEEGELERIDEILSRQGALSNFETLRTGKDGRLVHVDITVSLMRDSGGALLGRSVTYRDISLRRHLQKQLEENLARLESYRTELSIRLEELKVANKALKENQGRLIAAEKLSAIGEITARVAHEFRQPLVTIGGFAQTVMKSMDPGSRERRYLQIVVDEVRRLENIVAEILDFVKPGAETLPCDVNGLVARALAPHLSSMGFYGIQVVQDLEADLPPAEANADQIHQVLTNLIINAIQAINVKRRADSADQPPGRDSVAVSTRRGENHVRISIADTGAGIPEGHKERVFESFFTTKPDGSGLGLAIAARIVADHRATLTFESQEGQGTTFHLCLPTRRGGQDSEDDPRG